MPAGRPPKESSKIDKEELRDLMKFYPTTKEVCDWFDVKHELTIVRFIKKHFHCNFDELRDKSFIRTKVAIKRAQLKKALAGDNTMLIWVGKQYLGQTDKMDQKNEISSKNESQVVITLPTNGSEKEIK